MTAFKIDKQSGKLTEINKVSSNGWYTAAVGINSTGSQVVCANYIGATATLFNVRNDGGLHEAS